MRKAKKRRMFVVGESIIQVQQGKLIQVFNFDKEDIIEEIGQIMEEKMDRPSEIFKNAIENLTGEKFGDVRMKFIIDDVEFCILDQSIYKKCEQFIIQHERFKENTKSRQQRKNERKNHIMKNRDIYEYFRREHYRALKCKEQKTKK